MFGRRRSEAAARRVPQPHRKIRVGFRQAATMILLHSRKKILEQARSVAFIVVFLVLVQVLVLRQPLVQAGALAAGIACVVLGLAFFMEGLFLGVMPLGETCGLNLPGRVPLPLILLFALLLGAVATFAEPAILALRAAAGRVRPWSTPLLFLLLNVRPQLLLLAVGVGVGLAVVLSMLRILRRWSLKPLLLAILPVLLAASVLAYFDANLRSITALAWDTGGVTTGPVTVPLVIALGLGVARSVGGQHRGYSGLGIVTLASLLPVLAVLTLGLALGSALPDPMSREDFFSAARRGQAAAVFEGESGLKAFALRELPLEEALYLFDGDREQMVDFLTGIAREPQLVSRHFGDPATFRTVLGKLSALERWLVQQGAAEAPPPEGALGGLLARNARLAVQAILPLSVFLVFVLLVVLRVLPARLDEFLLGVALSLVGFFLFSAGIETGISRLGDQAGRNLPTTYTSVAFPERARLIRPFDPTVVWPATTLEGEQGQFFFLQTDGKLVAVPYDPQSHDPQAGAYTYVPTLGPLLGPGRRAAGLLLAFALAFVIGYGATLAEPALNSLGRALEEVSVGTFRRSFLVKTVAVGVGSGIACGLARVIWDLPLVWFLVPVYLALIGLSLPASEEYVNIAWDSAGVTTGPVTVPLVIALGLGAGGQVGVAESFGLITLASAFPILSVLAAGHYLERRRRRRLLRG